MPEDGARVKAIRYTTLRGMGVDKGEMHDLPEKEADALVATGSWVKVKRPKPAPDRDDRGLALMGVKFGDRKRGRRS